nr:hypothetical protein CFP56_66195 [Quercus suber]
MWGVIKRALQFIGSDLYVTVDTIGFNVDEGSYRARDEESVPVTNVYPSVTAETCLPYNVKPCNVVAMDKIEDAKVLGSIRTHEGRGYTHGNEDIQGVH